MNNVFWHMILSFGRKVQTFQRKPLPPSSG